MNRLLRARLWLGAAGVGAVVFVASISGLVRSCQFARSAYADTIVEKDAHIWRHAYARSTPR